MHTYLSTHTHHTHTTHAHAHHTHTHIPHTPLMHTYLSTHTHTTTSLMHTHIHHTHIHAHTTLMHTQMTATSAFTTTTVEVPASLTNLTTYNAVVNKLNRLWDDQMTAVQQVTDVSKLVMTAVPSLVPRPLPDFTAAG